MHTIGIDSLRIQAKTIETVKSKKIKSIKETKIIENSVMQDSQRGLQIVACNLLSATIDKLKEEK